MFDSTRSINSHVGGLLLLVDFDPFGQFLFLGVQCLLPCINPLTPEDFHIFERFSAFTRPIGLRDSIFKVTIESAAVLKH